MKKRRGLESLVYNFVGFVFFYLPTLGCEIQEGPPSKFPWAFCFVYMELFGDWRELFQWKYRYFTSWHCRSPLQHYVVSTRQQFLSPQLAWEDKFNSGLVWSIEANRFICRKKNPKNDRFAIVSYVKKNSAKYSPPTFGLSRIRCVTMCPAGDDIVCH